MLLFGLLPLFLAGGCESVQQDLGVDLPAEEQSEDLTSDGIDNDGDGTIDEPDEAALAPSNATAEPSENMPAGETEENPVTDGIDNDGDGTIDEPDEARMN